MNLFWKILRDQKGSAIIETALIIPFLMGLFIGLVFFTNGMRYKLVVNMAAKEGARAYQVSGGSTQRAISRAYEELSIGNVAGASVSCSGGTVKVNKPYGFYIPASGRYLLNIKAEHIFKEEINPRYYEDGW